MDSCRIWCPQAEKTQSAAESFTKILYGLPVTVTLSGELGAGKTTFLRSWLQSIGVTDAVTSPTFALEQRYRTRLGPVIHLDLYRLTPPQAGDLLRQSADEHAIKCIEWPEKAEKPFAGEPLIRLRFTEKGNGREITCEFDDAPIPAREQIEQWRNEVLLPPHIRAHCDAVADLCERIAVMMQEQGRFIRPLLLRRAAEVHDLLRFIDFKPGAKPKDVIETTEELQTWALWKGKYEGKKHEAACAQFLREQGFDAVATVVEPHGLVLPSPNRTTIEQQILFYADKRVMVDNVVSLEERFDDFAKRYGKGVMTAQAHLWLNEAKRVEQELFPEGVPV